MVEAGLRTQALADAVGVSRATVSSWLNGKSLPDRFRLASLHKVLRDAGAKTSLPVEDMLAVRETPRAEYRPGWPEGWQARTYRLALEAAEAGATEEEIAVVRGWMMDPQLQLLWSGGAPTELKELDGIEIGARAWLRARGRKVRKDVPEPTGHG